MSDLDTRFEAAVAASRDLPERPDNAGLLKMYALYKQATSGDAAGKRPGFTDPVGRAKYDAWAAIAGTSPEGAKSAYADLVESLGG